MPLWVALVPMHDFGVFLFVGWQIIRNVMGHAGVEMYPVSGKPSRLFGWWNATTHHELHHRDARGNYGLYFSWWDRWMGTEHPELQAVTAEVAERCRAASKKPDNSSGKIVAVFLAVAVGVGLLHSVRAEAQTKTGASGIVGTWATQGFGSVVRIAPCGDAREQLCGQIIWLAEPNDSKGNPRRDGKNPERVLRNRPIVGIDIIQETTETRPGVWTVAALYNPDDGRTYSGEIRLHQDRVELKGCALGMFCQTQRWRRLEDVLRSLEAAAASNSEIRAALRLE